MNTNNLFTICVIVRLLLFLTILLLSNYIYNRNEKIHPVIVIISIFLLSVSLGFLMRYKKYNSEQRGAFGSKVWWNNYRLFHSFTYFLAGLLILNKKTYKYAAFILLFDVLAGIGFYANEKIKK